MPPYFNNFFTTPGINPAAEEERKRLINSRNPLMRFGGDIKPTPLSRPPQPMVLPAGAPPLSGTMTPPASPPRLERPSAVPMPANMPTLASPNRIAEPLSRPRNYRGNEIMDELGFARDQYVREGGTVGADGKLKVKRSLGGTLQNALIGLGQGLATGQGLGAGIGGAVAGAAGSLINPLAGRERAFEAFRAPQIREGMQARGAQLALEREAEALQRQGAMDALKAREIEADIALKGAQTNKALQPAIPRPQAPQLRLGKNRESGEVGYYNALDPNESAQFSPTQFERPRTTREPSINERLTRANLEEIEREGEVPQIAQDVVRGQRDAIIASAPEVFRSILQTGKKADGKMPTTREINDAQSWLNKETDRRYTEQLRVTGSIRKKNAARRALGKAPAAGKPTANLMDLEKLWR